jgi:hypothetical protein
MRHIFYAGAVLLLLASLAAMARVARAQAPPPPPAIQPVPISGGDVVPPVGIINIFSPGVGTGFDGMDAEPHVFSNFRGVSAMGYTLGTATDNSGNAYQVITDIRVFQGDYVGGQSTYGAGGTTSAKTHGTFVEI